MILELDQGNTRIKWRLLRSDRGPCLREGVAGSLEQLQSLIADVDAIAAARMSSVRDPDSRQGLADWVEGRWQVPMQQARVSRSCAGVHIHYAEPGRLGVDRWLAMLAAYDRNRRACLVVDAGTAVTIDVLAEDGNHRGGYILPGRELMVDCLEANTRIRLQHRQAPDSIGPGNSTEEAVLRGSLASQVALIRSTAEAFGEADIFLAGGDAQLLQRQLDLPRVEITLALVLDGLSLACPMPAGE